MMPLRECSWPGCHARVPANLWGCKTHWFRLPKEIRDRIWANYRPGQETEGGQSSAYWDAYKEALRWIGSQPSTETTSGQKTCFDDLPDPRVAEPAVFVKSVMIVCTTVIVVSLIVGFVVLAIRAPETAIRSLVIVCAAPCIIMLFLKI